MSSLYRKEIRRRIAQQIIENKEAILERYNSPFQLLDVVQFIQELYPEDDKPSPGLIVMAVHNLLDAEPEYNPVLRLTSDRRLAFLR